jgi:long-chain acyl-CoA synthetase
MWTIQKNTLNALLEQAFEKYGDLPSIASIGEKPLTYSQLKLKVEDRMRDLTAHGIRPGDRVIILSENCPNWVIVYFSVTFLGAVAVPILPGFSEENIRHIVRDSGAVAAFAAAKFLPRVQGVDPVRIVWKMEDFSKAWSRSGEAARSESQPHQAGPKPEDLAVIIYTSGTTGHSKGVMLTHDNIVFDVVHALEKFPLSSRDVFLSILPLSHTFEATGGLLCPLAMGVGIFYMQGLPTPKNLLTSMESARPTGVLTVPLVIDKIYRKRILPQIQAKPVLRILYGIPFFRKRLNHVAGKKLIKSLGGRLRFFMFGGAALNEDVEVFMRDAGISYSTGYGMTETSPIMTINPFGKVRVGSCGQPIPGIEMKIDKPDPKTGVGEIVVKGSIVMQGYINNPKATRDVLSEDGWLRTGDLGFFDEEGYLFIKGRSKNIIVGPNGENIYPEIIEARLMQKFSFVQQAVVYQKHDKLVVKAYLDPDAMEADHGLSKKTAEEADALVKTLLETVRTDINTELPSFSAIHRMVWQKEPFELTPTNKVKRYLYMNKPSPPQRVERPVG